MPLQAALWVCTNFFLFQIRLNIPAAHIAFIITIVISIMQSLSASSLSSLLSHFFKMLPDFGLMARRCPHCRPASGLALKTVLLWRLWRCIKVRPLFLNSPAGQFKERKAFKSDIFYPTNDLLHKNHPFACGGVYFTTAPTVGYNMWSTANNNIFALGPPRSISWYPTCIPYNQKHQYLKPIFVRRIIIFW